MYMIRAKILFFCISTKKNVKNGAWIGIPPCPILFCRLPVKQSFSFFTRHGKFKKVLCKMLKIALPLDTRIAYFERSDLLLKFKRITTRSLNLLVFRHINEFSKKSIWNCFSKR